MTARRLPDGDKRVVKVTARFTAEQAADLRAMAGGLTLSTWLYDLALKEAEITDTARRAAPKTPTQKNLTEGAPS